MVIAVRELDRLDLRILPSLLLRATLAHLGGPATVL